MKETQNVLKQLDDFLELYLIKKAPAIPANIKELIVKYGPYVSLVAIIISLPVLLAALGASAFLVPASFIGGISSGFSFTISTIISVVVIVMEAIALPGLFKRAASSWRLMYYAALVGAVQSLLTLNFVSLVVGTVISLYVLFQIKSYYK